MQAAAPPMVAGAPGTTGLVATAAVRPLVFAEVYEEYFGFVWRSASGLGVRSAAIEDVVQEIFVVVHRLLAGFEGRSTLRTWLSKIVLNVVRHHRRSQMRRSPHETSGEPSQDPDDLPAGGLDPCESAALSEGTRLVQRLLDSLDEEKREILVLAEFEQLTVPEIADALALKLNTAYSRLRLARRAFDEALARQRAQDRGRQP